MFKREDLAIHIKNNNIQDIEPLYRERFQWINVNILYKDSFSLCPNFNIENLINNEFMLNPVILTKLQESEIKYDFTYNEIMQLNNNNIDFYLLDDIRFKKIMSNIGFNNFVKRPSNTFLMEEKDNYILFFSSAFRYILIEKEKSTTNIAVNEFVQMNTSNNEEYQERIPSQIEQDTNKKGIIIRTLILLNGNDKEIANLYRQGMYNLKNYYLINKDWVDKFKEIYYYNEVSKIPIIKGITNLEVCVNNLKTFESLNEIKLIHNKIKIDYSTLPKKYLKPIEKHIDENGQYKYIFPTNFTIISKCILDLFNYLYNCSINSKYEITFGKCSLCLRSYNDLNKIYIYSYEENTFYLSGIIDLFGDAWNQIYDRYLSKNNFSCFLFNKKINEDLKFQKQNLISTGNRHLGYIYLVEERQRVNRFQGPIFDKKDSKSYDININKISNNKAPNNIRYNIHTVPVMNDFQPDNEIEFNKKLKIIKILVLLCVNEKEINKLYSQGIYNLQNFHIVNKVWIDKFKQIFNNGEMYNLPLLKDTETLDDCNIKLQNLGVSNEITAICDKINLNTFPLSQINFTPNIKIIDEYNFVDNFLLIHGSIINLLKDFANIQLNTNNEISFGISSLFLRSNYILNKIYIYNYDNDAFNITCIIHLFDDHWKPIYDKYFSKIDIYQYFANKQINLNMINQKQNLFSTLNVHMGYIILLKQMSQNIIPVINENILNMQDTNFINTANNVNNFNININEEPICDYPILQGENTVHQQNNEKQSRIIKCLILLYVNEKEIKKMFLQGNYILKNYYLINKECIDKFKEIFHYNEICNIPAIKEKESLEECEQNLDDLLSLNEIQAFSNNININSCDLFQSNLSSNFISIGEIVEYNPPENFLILNESLKIMLTTFFDGSNIFNYNIFISNSMLYVQWENCLSIVYVYNYKNDKFLLKCIFEFFGDEFWNDIYNKYLSKMTFNQYLCKHNINLNIIKQKQDLLSLDTNNYLGYIYLIEKSFETVSVEKINKDNNNNNNNHNIFNSIYNNLIKSLNSFKLNQLNTINIETIQNLYESNLLFGLSLYIIETTKLNYCLQNPISVQDIIFPDKISEQTKYSFINKDICTYFNIQNFSSLSNVFLFVNQQDAVNKFIYIYYPKEKYLLNVVNYNKNSFNLKKISPQNQILPPLNIIQNNIVNQTMNNHALGLANTGGNSYINSTLQCLCHIDLLKNYFMDDNIYNFDILSKPTSLSKLFADIVRTLWSQTYETVCDATEFKNKLIQINPSFNNNGKIDLGNLLLGIFDIIHNELNNPYQNPYKINPNNMPIELYQFMKNYYSQNYSIITQLFNFENCNIIECVKCRNKIYSYNSIKTIIFYLDKIKLYKQKINPNDFSPITLNECFEKSQQPEIFISNNQIYCNNCRMNSSTYSYNQLYTCPEVLIILLNREQFFEQDILFSFPMNISLEKYIIDQTCNSNYDLISILSFQSIQNQNKRTLHCISYCKSPVDNKWYIYNDANITPCYSNNIEDEMQSNIFPYILFYQRKNNQDKYITFIYEGRKGFYNYNDDNKLLYEVYNEFISKNLWAPKKANLMIMKSNCLTNLDMNKTIIDNGINKGDTIFISIN